MNQNFNKNYRGQRKLPSQLVVEFFMDDAPQYILETKSYRAFFTIFTRRGDKPAANTEIQEIWIDHQKYGDNSDIKGMMATDLFGKFDFEAGLNPEFRKVRVTALVAGKRYQTSFPIPEKPESKADKLTVFAVGANEQNIVQGYTADNGFTVNFIPLMNDEPTSGKVRAVSKGKFRFMNADDTWSELANNHIIENTQVIIDTAEDWQKITFWLEDIVDKPQTFEFRKKR